MWPGACSSLPLSFFAPRLPRMTFCTAPSAPSGFFYFARAFRLRIRMSRHVLCTPWQYREGGHAILFPRWDAVVSLSRLSVLTFSAPQHLNISTSPKLASSPPYQPHCAPSKLPPSLTFSWTWLLVCMDTCGCSTFWASVPRYLGCPPRPLSRIMVNSPNSTSTLVARCAAPSFPWALTKLASGFCGPPVQVDRS